MDRINKSIVNELIQDPHLTSERISKKLRVPLSTVQRRRATLERSVLNKMYSLDLSTFGWRIADLLIGMNNGDPHSTARNIVQENSKNIVSASLRIGSPELIWVPRYAINLRRNYIRSSRILEHQIT
jgi:DNA-binding Lrp family transcriptional regulator